MICIIKKSEESKGKTCSLLVPRAGTWQSQWAGGRREMVACRVASRTSCPVLRVWGPQAFLCVCGYLWTCVCVPEAQNIPLLLPTDPGHTSLGVSSPEVVVTGWVRAACWQGAEGRGLGSSSEAHPSSNRGFTCGPSSVMPSVLVIPLLPGRVSTSSPCTPSSLHPCFSFLLRLPFLEGGGLNRLSFSLPPNPCSWKALPGLSPSCFWLLIIKGKLLEHRKYFPYKTSNQQVPVLLPIKTTGTSRQSSLLWLF